MRRTGLAPSHSTRNFMRQKAKSMKKCAPWLSTVAMIGAIAMAAPAHAQLSPIPPGADPAVIGTGMIERQRDLPPPEQLPDQPPITGDGAPAATPEGPVPGVTFELKAVTFDPSAFLSKEALDAVAAQRIGKRVSIADLRTIAAEVNALYAARGIATARAYVPPQKIVDGVARIALVEGRLGVLDIAEGRYTGAGYVRSRIAITPGEIVDLNQLRRQITAFNRGNDMRIQAQLRPGSEVGLTDVVISIAEPPRNGGQLFADTSGYESTGRYQGGVALRRSALFVDGDRLNLYGSLSDGGITGSISYSVLAGAVRLGLTYGRSQITVTQGPSASLDIQGFSDTASLNVARSLVERDSWYATAIGAVSYTASENRLADRTVGQSRVYKGTGGIALDYDSGGGAAVNLKLTVSGVRAEDSLDPAGFSFAMFNADLTAQMRLGGAASLRFSAAGQHAGATYIPSNQFFQLGGPVSVRGFQPGTASGSSGYYAQTELHWAFSKTTNAGAFAFIDHGKTFSRDFGDRPLGSVGLGVRIPIGRFDLETSVGIPITQRRQNEDRYRADARIVWAF